MFEIRQFQKSDTDEVIDLVLHCQNDGSRPTVSVKNQPELLYICEKYIANGGNFWVAVQNGQVAGSIGLMNGGQKIAILKKFFVYEAYRGYPYHLGQQLYHVLLEFAIEQGFERIILDTPKNTARAHRFYEKAGFKKIEASELPLQYDYPYQGSDCDFFCLKLSV